MELNFGHPIVFEHMNNFQEGTISVWATEIKVLKLQTWQSDSCRFRSCCDVSKIWKYLTINSFCIFDMLWKRRWGTTSMKKAYRSEQEKIEFQSSQQIWRVDRKIITSHSSYLSFLSYTAPRDLKFGYVVVHKLRNNFNEESMLIWARENRVSKLTTNLTGWQTNDKQSLIIPGFLELYCSDGSPIWICCS